MVEREAATSMQAPFALPCPRLPVGGLLDGDWERYVTGRRLRQSAIPLRTRHLGRIIAPNPLGADGLKWGCYNSCRDTRDLGAQRLGVQIGGHSGERVRSPKPQVAGSSPAAPASFSYLNHPVYAP